MTIPRKHAPRAMPGAWADRVLDPYCEQPRHDWPHQPEPPASVRRQRPPLAPSVGTSFGTDENLDAQNAWLAHIEAGRIEVK
jgi:hypothetical protein